MKFLVEKQRSRSESNGRKKGKIFGRPGPWEIFSDLEQTIKEMEDGEISLEESFSLYQQGVLQLKNCGTILDEVEKKMQILGEDGEIEEM